MSVQQSSGDEVDLQIIGAVYGLGSVTDTVIDLVDRSTTPQSLTVVASNDVFGDTWPGNEKTLTVAYRWGDTGAVCVGVVEENQTLTVGEAEYEQAQQLPPVVPPADATLSVLAATYGPSVVTATVAGLVDPATQSVSVVADTVTIGDSWEGVVKTLVVVADCTGQVPYVDIVQENDTYSTQYRPPLQIISASWGLADVTATAQGLIEQQSLTVEASNDVFGDGWPGVEKTLDVVYQYGDQQQQLAIATEGNTLVIDYTPLPAAEASPDPRTLAVIKAAYGTADVTEQVIALISGQSLNFVADNATFGDSWPGVVKSFTMAYTWGPSTSSSVVVAENSQVQISQPPVAFTQGVFTLGDLIADGDSVALGAPNGYLLTSDPTTGAVLANGAERSAQVAFTVHAVADQLGQFTMTDSQQRPVCVAADGTLVCVAGGDAAVLVFSMTTSGAITLGVVGAGESYSIVQDDGTVLAGGSDTDTYNASYRLELQPSEEGTQAHLMAYAGLEASSTPSPELLKLTWDLTGGFFLAIGLGPLLAGESKAAPGIYKLICTNPEVKAALDAIWMEVRANPYSTLSVASLFTFVGTVWDAGMMLKIFRLALSAAGWWLIGLAIAKLLEWSVLPEAAAAELVASFAIWAYTTTVDALAFINSGSGSSAAAAARVAAEPVLAAV
ncbi:MAG: hypothetical protein JO144_11085 [Actinobacteria bacterium]|nr:hypothetical protein [Actinomycetota bacterium]